MSGAGRWRAFRDIELPLIWPGVSGAATFSFILSFNETVRTALVQGPLNTSTDLHLVDLQADRAIASALCPDDSC